MLASYSKTACTFFYDIRSNTQQYLWNTMRDRKDQVGEMLGTLQFFVCVVVPALLASCIVWHIPALATLPIALFLPPMDTVKH
jgi:hypothetical protein